MEDRTMPTGAWEFDAEVTAAFDDMLERSIPQYHVMRLAVLDVGSAFVRDDTSIVDLGCSRGEALAPFVGRFAGRCRLIGVERSAPMIAAARERFARQKDSVEILDLDLRETFPDCRNASLVLSVLTLQFTPIERRHAILARAFEALEPGGALVLVEKVIGGTAAIDALLVKTYYALKASNGYSDEAIERKRLSLEGVLVPVTAEWNEDLLRASGFRTVECFWRWMNFAGWVAIK